MSDKWAGPGHGRLRVTEGASPPDTADVSTPLLVQARADAAVEIRLTQDRWGLTLATYTFVLQQIRKSLETIDRLAVTHRSPRVSWAVGELSSNGEVAMLLVPRQINIRREPLTYRRPVTALTEGIDELGHQAEVPAFFDDTVVRRVQNLGHHVGSGGLDSVRVASVIDGERGRQVSVTRETADNAARSVLAASSAHSSFTGLLTLLSQSRTKIKAVIQDPESHHNVVCDVGQLDKAELRGLWGESVTAWGLLTRNALGQPIGLAAEGIEPVPQQPHHVPIHAADLLGAAPDWTGGLSVQAYQDLARSRA